MTLIKGEVLLVQDTLLHFWLCQQHRHFVATHEKLRVNNNVM